MPVKIMYLDDEPDICDAFKENFESKQFIVFTFTDHAAFLAAFKTIEPDLVFFRLPFTKYHGRKNSHKHRRIPTHCAGYRRIRSHSHL